MISMIIMFFIGVITTISSLEFYIKLTEGLRKSEDRKRCSKILNGSYFTIDHVKELKPTKTQRRLEIQGEIWYKNKN